VAWIIFVAFPWLTWPGKRKPGIRDYHSKRTLPAVVYPPPRISADGEAAASDTHGQINRF
jgi:hypothetical protein